MKTSEYLAKITADLKEAMANHGDIPVVMWVHDKHLSEHSPRYNEVASIVYTSRDSRGGINDAKGTVFVIGGY